MLPDCCGEQKGNPAIMGGAEGSVNFNLAKLGGDNPLAIKQTFLAQGV